MERNRVLTSICCALLMVAACEEEEQEQAPSPAARHATAVCAKSFACCSADELPADTTEADCVSNTTNGVSSMIGSAKDSESQGRLTFHDDKFDACTAAIESASCAQWPAVMFEGPCDQYTVPKVAEGGVCTDDQECLGGRCTITSDEEGTCDETIAQGNDCSTVSCAADLYCDGVNVCVPKKAASEICTSFSECISENCGYQTTDATEQTCGEAECYQGCAAAGAPGVWLAGIMLLGHVARRKRRARPQNAQ